MVSEVVVLLLSLLQENIATEAMARIYKDGLGTKDNNFIQNDFGYKFLFGKGITKTLPVYFQLIFMKKSHSIKAYFSISRILAVPMSRPPSLIAIS